MIFGMETSAMSCHATCVSGSLPLIFQQSITETFVLGVFILEKWARMNLYVCFACNGIY